MPTWVVHRVARPGQGRSGGFRTLIAYRAKTRGAIRASAHMSQAVFASYLSLTVGYVSQLELGAKRPTGAALALLNIIKRKGIEAIL